MNPRPQSRSGVITLGVLVLLAVFIRHESPHADARTTPVVHAITTEPDASLSRPRTWLGHGYHERPLPEEIQTYEQGLRTAAAMFHVAETHRERVTDPAALARIIEAQELIQARHEPPGSWRWTDMQSVAAGVGTTYPIYRAAGISERQTTILAWDGSGHALYVFDDWNPADIDPVNLAEVLVHESTHEVVIQQIAAGSGYSETDLLYTQVVCEDVSTMLNFVTEALAYTNEAAWAVSNPEGPSSYGPSMRTVMQAASARFETDPAARLAFASHMMEYARRETAEQHIEHAGSYGELPAAMTCGPMPFLSGPRRGEYFLPSDISLYTVTLLRTLE